MAVVKLRDAALRRRVASPSLSQDFVDTLPAKAPMPAEACTEIGADADVYEASSAADLVKAVAAVAAAVLAFTFRVEIVAWLQQVLP